MSPRMSSSKSQMPKQDALAIPLTHQMLNIRVVVPQLVKHVLSSDRTRNRNMQHALRTQALTIMREDGVTSEMGSLF